jgi:hypothetical protein
MQRMPTGPTGAAMMNPATMPLMKRIRSMRRRRRAPKVSGCRYQVSECVGQ